MGFLRRRNRRKKASGSRLELPKLELRRTGRVAGALAALATLGMLLAVGLDQPVRSIVIDGPFQRVAAVDRTYTITPPKVFSIEEARARLERILGSIPEWTEFRTVAAARDIDAPLASVMASAFNAALEFAKNGRLDIRQLAPFEPIYVRRRATASADGDAQRSADSERMP